MEYVDIITKRSYSVSTNYNKKCKRCKKSCKQSDTVKVVGCPSYDPIDPSKEPVPIPPKKKTKKVDKK